MLRSFKEPVYMIENYENYHLSKRELFYTLAKGSGLLIVTAFLFYQNILFAILLSPALLILVKQEKRKKAKLRRWELNLQFRDGLLSLVAALDAGYAIENAFSEANRDLKLIYKETDLIVLEFTQIIHRLSANQNIEDILIELGNRSGVEDIICFAEIFQTAKRSGGDITKVIRSSCSMISDKIEIKRDIKTIISGKKMEADIMKLVPVGMIGYFLLTSPGFLSPLYHNLAGGMIMTVILIIYLGAIKLMDFIVDIQV